MTFVPNKSQRKVNNKFLNFIEGTRPEGKNNKEKKKLNKLEVPLELSEKIAQAIRNTIAEQAEYSENYLKIIRNVPQRALKYGEYSTSASILITNINKHLKIENIHSRLLQEITLILNNTQ